MCQNIVYIHILVFVSNHHTGTFTRARAKSPYQLIHSCLRPITIYACIAIQAHSLVPKLPYRNTIVYCPISFNNPFLHPPIPIRLLLPSYSIWSLYGLQFSFLPYQFGALFDAWSRLHSRCRWFTDLSFISMNISLMLNTVGFYPASHSKVIRSQSAIRLCLSGGRAPVKYYFIFASVKSTCAFTRGSNFRNSNFPGSFFGFFFLT